MIINITIINKNIQKINNRQKYIIKINKNAQCIKLHKNFSLNYLDCIKY